MQLIYRIKLMLMHVQLWSIGRDNEAVYREALHIYVKRLIHYTEFSLLVIPGVKNGSSLPVAELKKKEASLMLNRLSDQDYLIALDEHGHLLDSPGVAHLLEAQIRSNRNNLIFLTGGAYGLDTSILDAANLILSLSRLTFPHQLARLVMAEQIYRAFTLIRNEKYHHQ